MGITYADLLLMDDEDLAEANAALDIHIKQQRKNSKAK